MNTAGNLGVHFKASVVEEANKAFEFKTLNLKEVSTIMFSQVTRAMITFFPAHLLLVIGSDFTGVRSCWGLLALENSASTLLRLG